MCALSEVGVLMQTRLLFGSEPRIIFSSSMLPTVLILSLVHRVCQDRMGRNVFSEGEKKEGGHPIDLSGFSNSIIPQAEISEAVSIGS